MANFTQRPDWQLPERFVTPEHAWSNRRRFLRKAGLALGAIAGGPWSSLLASETNAPTASATTRIYPAHRTPEFDPKLPLTDESVAGSYNNFYEFSLNKSKVRELVGNFVTNPWKIEVTGLVEKPMTLDLDDLLKLAPSEERVYRFRCVEAWAMIVPWTGFPLSKLIEKVKPTSEARFIRFETFNRPTEAPGMIRLPNYPWPYFEGLRMDEAMNPLTLLATGIYGHPLPKQHGAPIRLVVPWKYGYKSIKSIVKIEFISRQPKTFWETLAADEYPFESNVDPKVPHPRWSQAVERMIDTQDYVKTQPFNGYGKYVAHLYSKA